MDTPDHPGRLRRVVLAGPIGSGKSTVGAMLAARGAEVIEADVMGHAILQPGAEGHAAVAARWPQVVVDGRIDRGRLAAIVFTDARALRVLEALTHPHIAARIDRLAAQAGDAPVVVEMPLTRDILGNGWPRLVVMASAERRLQRAVRRGMDASDARRRMEAQPGEEDWVASADWVIHNDGSPDDLERVITQWWHDHIAAK